MATIGILGTGTVGDVLADGFLKHGYDVYRGSRDPKKSRTRTSLKRNGTAAMRVRPTRSKIAAVTVVLPEPLPPATPITKGGLPICYEIRLRIRVTRRRISGQCLRQSRKHENRT